MFPEVRAAIEKARADLERAFDGEISLAQAMASVNEANEAISTVQMAREANCERSD
jgi:hypothetical protein